jgi:hypothetical protein
VSRSASTRYTPAKLLTGRKFCQNHDLHQNENEDRDLKSYADEEFDCISSIRSQAAKFIKSAQDQQKKYHDESHMMLMPLKIGDQVLLY